MMGKRIDNVGVLNLLNATEESVQAYEHFGNVGVVFFREGQRHLLNLLNIDNLGASVELPDGYNYYNGELRIDRSYLASLGEETRLLVNGTVTIAEDVEVDQLDPGKLRLIVNGELHTPHRLTGAISNFTAGNRVIRSYEGRPPRTENGSFTLNNAVLQGADHPLNLTVNGLLELDAALDMELFHEKVEQITVNGIATMYESQESAAQSKLGGSVNGKIEVIPDGYVKLAKMARVNGRSIRRYRGKKLLTRKPILFEADVTRQDFTECIEKIHSTSFIVCSEEIEDLAYEKLDRMETEVLTYGKHFHYIDGEQTWSESQLASMEPGALIVKGKLLLEAGVTAASITEKIDSLDLFGEVHYSEEHQKNALQPKVRLLEGRFRPVGELPEKEGIQNVGELVL